MRKEEIEERIRKLISDYLGIDGSGVALNAIIIDDLGADSLDTIEMLDAAQKEFNIEISHDAAEKIMSIRDAIEYIQEHGSFDE